MNPFKILNVNANATPKQVVQAMALAMRRKKYSAREVAQAQKLLLDPVKQQAQSFLHCLDLNALKEPLQGDPPAEPVSDPAAGDPAGLPRLALFDQKR